MNWIFLSGIVFAAKQIKKIPDIVTYSSEVYTGSLLSYFSGVEMTFLIQEKSSSEISVKLDSELSINVIDLIPLESTESVVPQKLTSLEVDEGYFILIMNNTNVLLIFLNKFDLNLTIFINEDLSLTYPDMKIDQGILTESGIIVLIHAEYKINEYSFRKHEILYAEVGDVSLQPSDCLWDIRYFHNLLMSITDSEFLAIGTREEDQQFGAIFIYSFQNLSCPVLIQMIDRYYTIPSYLSEYWLPDPIDLAISKGQLLVLNSYNIFLLFEYKNDRFQEVHFSNFTGFGNVKSFSIAPGYSLCAVAADDFIIIYDIEIYSMILYLQSTWSSRGRTSIFLTQIQPQYVYFSSTSNLGDVYFEIVDISLDAIQYLTFVNMDKYIPFNKLNYKGPWIVFNAIDGRFLIRQDLDGVRVFFISIPSYTFEVSSEVSGSVNFLAVDMFSTASCVLNLTVLDRLDQVTFLNGYYPAEVLYYDFPVFFMNKSQTIEIDLFSMFTGWNLSFSYKNEFTEVYNYSVTNLVEFYNNFTIIIENGCIYAGYFGNVLYFIDDYGIVYKNSDVLESYGMAEKIEPIYEYSADIAILFPGFIIVYNEAFDHRHKISVNISCIIFRGFFENVVCASFYNVLLINTTSVFKYISYNELGSRGKIKDVVMVISHNTTQADIYVLMTTGVYMFKKFVTTIVPKGFMKIEGDKLFSSGKNLVVLNSLNLSTYTSYFNERLKNFELYSNYDSALMNYPILLLQSGSHIFLYETTAPVLRSLITTLDVGNCKISSFLANFYVFICGNSIKLYTSRCPPSCNIVTFITFNLIDISITNQGSYRVPVPLRVTNFVEEIDFSLFFMLYTYGATVFFSDEGLNYNVSYAYDVESSIDLRFFINGYCIDTLLYINDVPQYYNNEFFIDSPPVQLVNRTESVFEVGYNQSLRDFSIIKFTDVILLLNPEFIIILNGSIQYRWEFIIDIKEYLNGTCSTIDFIDRNETVALFIVYCLNYVNISSYYYDGDLEYFYQYESVLLFLALDIQTFDVLSSDIFYLPFEPSWIRIIQGSGNRFLVLCLSSSHTEAGSILNNEVYVFKFRWNGLHFELTRQFEINFFTLGLENFHASFIDGLYKNNNKIPDRDIIVLYVADLSFGIRVVRITDDHPLLIQNLDFHLDFPVSLTVCGSILFCFTLGTHFIQYTINDYLLVNKILYPASPTNEYLGVNSAATCSDYYVPAFIGFFLKNTNQVGVYKLRIMNVFSSFNSSLHKDITISCKNCSSFRVKSIFIGDNLICYLNNEFKSFEISNLSSNLFYLPKFSKNSYKKMLDTYKNDTFNLTILATNQNSGFSISSNPFILYRQGPDKKEDDDKIIDLTLLVALMIVGIILALICVSICVFRRFIKKKQKVSDEIPLNRIKISPLATMKISGSVLSNYGSVLNTTTHY